MDPESILVTNLTEALQQLQRYMVWSFTASMLFLVLAILQPAEVNLPTVVIPLPIPLQGAIAILIPAYWISGALATFSLGRAKRIIVMLGDMLGDKKDVLAAALTYPSLPTTRVHGPRIILALAPPVFVIIGLVLLFGSRLLSFWSIVGVLLLVIPHVGLAVLLRKAVGGGVPDNYGD